jgi:hypothetical protein
MGMAEKMYLQSKVTKICEVKTIQKEQGKLNGKSRSKTLLPSCKNNTKGTRCLEWEEQK